MNIRCAFVSTNSICQGQQVQPLWQPLFEDGIHINFAHKSFIWNNEATDQAHVHVVIVGFSYQKSTTCSLFENGVEQQVENINGYLANARNVFIENRSKPLCNTPSMSAGFKPADNGNLLLSEKEYEELLQKEPNAKKWIRPFSGGDEFINDVRRYCLWLKDIIGADLKSLPETRKRIDACKEWRGQQTKTGDAYKLKDTPHLLRPCNKFKDTTWIAVPETSSERRKYVPMGFVNNGMIPSNALRFLPTDNLFIFGILNSTVHNAWMRAVAGRLKSDYKYSNTIVYNNFPWPGVTREALDVPVEECVPKEVRENIEACAQEVLNARAFYEKQAQDAGQACSLADMYDPNNDFLYPRLTSAHVALDAAVEQAYGVQAGGNEEKIVGHLFELYENLTN